VILLIRHDDIAESLPLHVHLPVLMFVLALGMMSSIRFPKIIKRKSNFINAFQIFNLIASYYCGITRSYPEFLFFMGLFLIVAGSVAGLPRLKSWKKKQQQPSKLLFRLTRGSSIEF